MAWNSDDSGIAKNSLGNYCTIDTKGCLDGWNCEFSEMKSYITHCLNITEKVSFNIANKASYVYILSEQKVIKIAKNGPFWRIFRHLKLAVKQCYQIKNGRNYQNWKTQIRHFRWFSNYLRNIYSGKMKRNSMISAQDLCFRKLTAEQEKMWNITTFFNNKKRSCWYFVFHKRMLAFRS